MEKSLEQLFLKARDNFPILKKSVNGHPFIYLDSAATMQKPQSVIDVMRKFYEEEYGTVHRSVYSTAAFATEAYHNVRKKIASFINAGSEEEIVFTRGTTASINLVASSFGKAYIKPNDEILLTEMEHHSNIVPWQLMAEERGAKIKVVPFFDNGELDIEALKKLLTPRTKILSITHISNTLGTVNPIKEIIRLAHEANVKVLVDGAQSARHMPCDMQDIDADFFVFSGHKIGGPTGIGVLYGKKELLDQMPPYEGGGDMIDTVTFSKTTYNNLPLKFEAGTPHIAGVIGLGCAIDFLCELGMDAICKWEEELLSYLIKKMQEIEEVSIIGSPNNRSGLVSFFMKRAHPLDVATLLDLRGIAIRTGHLCAQPVMRHFGQTTAARASIAFYNTKDEIDKFMLNLKNVIKILI